MINSGMPVPRSSRQVRDRVKFRVGQIVYVAFSQDETEIGCRLPEDVRAAPIKRTEQSLPLVRSVKETGLALF
jgi:hypothetical protein